MLSGEAPKCRSSRAAEAAGSKSSARPSSTQQFSRRNRVSEMLSSWAPWPKRRTSLGEKRPSSEQTLRGSVQVVEKKAPVDTSQKARPYTPPWA